MIKITNRAHCCGCSVCASVCPVSCIRMVTDFEGFFYPQVDVDRCVECGLCEQVCSFRLITAEESTTSVRAYAAKSTDDELRLVSSSGGVFTELSKSVISMDGVVYGVAMRADFRTCSFQRIEQLDGLAPLRGSKYIQADACGVYEKVERDLKDGRNVLFSGTPCQANGLRDYLNGDYPRLLVVDCICHGVPSAKLWTANIEDVEHRCGGKTKSVSFRNKAVGWRQFGIKMRVGLYDVFETVDHSSYLQLFLQNYCLRPSCYECKAKIRRLSDITIADFWGIESILPDMNDDIGLSLIIVRTNTGATALRDASNRLVTRDVDYNDAVRYNIAEYSSVARPHERDSFYYDLDTLSFREVVKRYTGIGKGAKMRQFVRKILVHCKFLN